MDKVLNVLIIILFLVGTFTVIAMATPVREGRSSPQKKCLIDKPLADCEIYVSGQAAWTPIIISGGT